jgi:hypothetical protein
MVVAIFLGRRSPVVGINRDTRDLSENPVVGKRSRPQRIDFETRDLAGANAIADDKCGYQHACVHKPMDCRHGPTSLLAGLWVNASTAGDGD